MPEAVIKHGTAYEQGTALFLARIISVDGDPLWKTDFQSGEYTVSQVDPCSPGGPVAVSGHDAEALSIDEVLFNSFQNDDAWSVDATGYNFRHELDVSTNDAFPRAGIDYMVRYRLVTSVGQPVVILFKVRAI